MRRVTRNGVLAVAASGALAVTMPAYAFASGGAAADGTAAGSPGLISGNTVQLPVDVPVNVCGNTVNVAGLLNPAAGNSCANTGGSGTAHKGAGASAGTGASGTGTSGTGTSGTGMSGGAVAEGGAEDSPGVLSGNGVRLPVHLPVNVSGNTVNVVGIGNPAVGNESVNTSGEDPGPAQPPVRPEPEPDPKPDSEPEPSVPEKERAQAEPVPHGLSPQASASLAHTGADQTLSALAGGAALVLGGVVLHRRFRQPGAGV
ncbi:chaplin [Streptomyces sp. DH41]|uniref:chaplin n=1 Tax=Streptomyces sp. DH41 TaxID=3040125 RepID=UPI0024436064|nr:chaplin [Streptomyces sp. DH41]MDG9724529.1 chaplin [Streptomyces sp. DH41]